MTVKYRLLSFGQIVEQGDQFLADDCETWSDVQGWEIGCRYNGIMVPVRRPYTPDALKGDAK